MIRWLLVSWVVNAIVLGIVGWILGSVTFHGSTSTVIWSALIFGILNTVLKPVLLIVTLPLALVTFGLAWFFVSMLMLWLTQGIIDGFDINGGFWKYVLATILVWAVNIVVDGVFKSDRRGTSRVWGAPRRWST